MEKATHRLYKDLAWLWPLWENVEEYKQESELFARLIKKHAKIKVCTLLDMGCGGGKNAFHLKRHFAVTGIDISKPMLKNAKKLNPECDFQIADMSSLNLKRQFDSVFINDSIVYMTTKRDLLKVFRSAYEHLKSGGVMITYPDRCKEAFKQNETTIWTSKRNNMDLTFIENNYDPNPRDNTFETTLIYLIRKRGKLRIERDLHVCGLFTLNAWRALLKRAGYEVHECVERVDTEHLPVFSCVKRRSERHRKGRRKATTDDK